MRTAKAATTALALALLCAACARQPRALWIEAAGESAERLSAILERSPLPAGWTIATSEGTARAVLELAPAEELTASPNAPSYAAGLEWLAPALVLADPRFSVSAAEAEALGLRSLGSIRPPLRAPRVEGLWPGEAGYPFKAELRLRVRGARPGSRAPRELERWAEAAAAAALASDEKPLRLCAVGDMQAGPAESPILAAGAGRVAELFRGGLVDTLRRPDLLVGNLEGAVSARGSPNPRKRFLFRMPPGTAEALLSAGFDLVLFANNHAFDYGPAAFDDTLVELEEAGLPYVGAGRDLTSALARRVLSPEGRSPIAFIGFASYPTERLGFTTEEAAAGPGKAGVNADEKGTLEAIAAAAAGGSTVVVLAHGGAEYVPMPPAYLRERYHGFADAGAALVFGSHPHVLQGVEARGSSLIAYSLGNFLFTGLEEPPESRRSAALLFLVYEGVARGLALEPVIVGQDGTDPDDKRSEAERRFAASCAALE